MMRKTQKIRINVFDIYHRLIKNALIKIKTIDSTNQEEVTSFFQKDYRSIPFIKPGKYEISVSASDYDSQTKEILIQENGIKETIILGNVGANYLNSTKSKQPFNVREDLIGFVTNSTMTEDVENGLQIYLKDLGLQPEILSPKLRNAKYRLFRYPENPTIELINTVWEYLLNHSSIKSVGSVYLFDNNNYLELLTNRIAIELIDDYNKIEFTEFLNTIDVLKFEEDKFLFGRYLLELNYRADYKIVDTCEYLISNKNIEKATPVTISPKSFFQVNATNYLYRKLWHLDLLRISETWDLLRNANLPGTNPGDPLDITFGSARVKIAILDTGIKSVLLGANLVAEHSDLESPLKNPDSTGSEDVNLSKIYCFANFNEDPPAPNNDIPEHWHGMAVASSAAANESSIGGVVGIAPNIQLISLMGINTDYNTISNAFFWMSGLIEINSLSNIVNGSDIINNSWGSSSPTDVEILEKAQTVVTNYGRNGRGTIIIWAAGNSMDENDRAKVEEDNIPATSDKAITVGASTIDNDGITEIISTYSCYGEHVDFCMPSHDDYEIWGIHRRAYFHNPPIITQLLRVLKKTKEICLA